MHFRDRYHYNPSSDKLGSGGFATVYRAHDSLLDREVALKIFNTEQSDRVNLLTELKTMSRLDHTNLIRCLDVLTVDKTDIHGQTEQMHIGVMEYANQGQLKTFIQTNESLETSRQLLIQVLQGLAYLHHMGIIHRDLKPQNILLSCKGNELVAKISDFGISKQLSSGTVSSAIMGTVEYMAPEQFNPVKYGIDGRIDTNLDLWSFGIIVFEMVTRKPLFGDGQKNTSVEEVMTSILQFSLPDAAGDLPEPFRTVVKRCLVPNANERAKDPQELIGYLMDGVREEPVERPVRKSLEKVPDHAFQGSRQQVAVEEVPSEKTIVREKKGGEALVSDKGVTGNPKEVLPAAQKEIPVPKSLNSIGSRNGWLVFCILMVSAILIGIGVQLQSMSKGPILAPYISGVMWGFCCLFSSLYIHLHFSGKSRVRLMGYEALTLKKLGRLAIGFTVLMPVISAGVYLMALSRYQGVIWDHYSENFSLGALILLSLYYLFLGIVFIIGMIQPQNIGYPARKAIALSVLLLFLTPLVLLWLNYRATSWVIPVYYMTGG